MSLTLSSRFRKFCPQRDSRGVFGYVWDICIITLFSYLRLKRKNETIFPISLLMIISPEDAYKYKNDRKSLTPISIRIYFFIVHHRQHPFLKKIFVLLLSQLALLFLSYSIYPNSLSTSNNTLDRKVVPLTYSFTVQHYRKYTSPFKKFTQSCTIQSSHHRLLKPKTLTTLKWSSVKLLPILPLRSKTLRRGGNRGTATTSIYPPIRGKGRRHSKCKLGVWLLPLLEERAATRASKQASALLSLAFIEFSESRAHTGREQTRYFPLARPIDRFERRSSWWGHLLGLDREIIFIQGSLSQPRSLSDQPDRKALGHRPRFIVDTIVVHFLCIFYRHEKLSSRRWGKIC